MDNINLKVGNIVKGNSHSPRRSNDIGIIIDKKTLGGKRYFYGKKMIFKYTLIMSWS